MTRLAAAPALALAAAAVCCRGALAAPSRWLDFSVSSAAAPGLCAAALARHQARLDELCAAPAHSADFKTTFAALSELVARLHDETAGLAFLARVSTDKGLREAAAACDAEVSARVSGIYASDPLYRLLSSTQARAGAEEPEDKRLVERTMLDFRRAGMELPPADRGELARLRRAVAVAEAAFQRNLEADRPALRFARGRLAGLPETFIKRLPRAGDAYVVSTDYQDYIPFMESAKDPSARRELELAFGSRGGEANQRLLEEALALRGKAARLLGYASHARLALEDRMARTPEEARRFLTRLEARLEEKGRPEMENLLALKAGEEGARSDGTLQAWDWRYYHARLLRSRHDLEPAAVREYFPLEPSVAGMLRAFEAALGVAFRQAQDPGSWSQDSSLYEVTDSASSELLGHFYLDLLGRDGKPAETTAVAVITGRRLPDGKYQRPVAALLASFPKPGPATPVLLSHDELRGLFHELGHVMHHVLSRASYERFSGLDVARDFVEAPALVFEDLAWDDGVLREVSGHYKDPSRKLPQDLLRRMIAARNADSGLLYLRQVALASFDLECHSRDVADTAPVFANLMEQTALVPSAPGARPQAGFRHIMSGGDASYYSYLWSEVLARGMSSLLRKEGFSSPGAGREFRRRILEPGGGADERLSVRLFLGREPNEEAFLANIGLEVGGAGPRPEGP